MVHGGEGWYMGMRGDNMGGERWYMGVRHGFE